MIEIKGTDTCASITGEGSLADLMAVYTGITQAVAQQVYRDTGSKWKTDNLMRYAWRLVCDDVFREEGDDT